MKANANTVLLDNVPIVYNDRSAETQVCWLYGREQFPSGYCDVVVE